MVLVEYSDSESDAEPKHPYLGNDKNDRSTLKRKRSHSNHNVAQYQPTTAKVLPALPSSFHSLYTTNVRSSTSDDPSLHGGRKRQMPHVEGNWPTHVYLEWMPSKTDLSRLDELISQAHKSLPTTSISRDQAKIYSFLRSDLSAQLPLHVSLSAPLVLTTTTKDNFRDELIRTLGRSHIKAFETTSSGLRWVSNSDQTRHFLVLGLRSHPNDELNQLLNICNRVVTKYDQPQLYASREATVRGDVLLDTNIRRDGTEEQQSDEHSKSQVLSSPFHISIAWTLEDPHCESPSSSKGTARVASSSINNDVASVQASERKSNEPVFTILFDRVKVKVGNIVEDVALA